MHLFGQSFDHDYYFELPREGERDTPSITRCLTSHHSDVQVVPMRSAPCALAPSHPLHVMPSRITRNSHRPRASDRTMVAMKHHLACCSLKLDGRVTINRETHENGQQAKLLQENETTVGWISGKQLESGRGRTFFLTSPFYRTHPMK